PAPTPAPTPAGALPATAGDARTGPLPLHPMTMSDILDGAFKLFKANARTLVLVTAAFVVPITVALAFAQRGSLVISGGSVRSSGQSSDLAVGLLLVGYYAIVNPLVAGAVSRVVADSYVGRATDGGTALRVVGRRWWALITASLITRVLEAIGFVLCIVPGIMLFGMFVGVPAAIVVEDLGPLRGINRSRRLLRPRVF